MTITTRPEDVGLCPKRLERVGGWMRAYVDDGKLPCALTLVARHGEIAFLDCCGLRDVEAGTAVAEDTIFRFYSMTKPVTAVAVMMLYEQGLFQLDDPVSAFIPELGGLNVYVSGDTGAMATEPVDEEITIRHLLTHTSGLTYGFLDPSPVGEHYRTNALDFGPNRRTLAEAVAELSKAPLTHQPGARWTYSVSFDVLGRLAEVISGQGLDRYFEDNIFSPLGMADTGFHVPADKHDRFASLYEPGPDGGIVLNDAAGESSYLKPPRLCSGGGGLVSTAGDYLKFTDMLRRKGAFDGGRLLGRKTVELMTANHLPGDMAAMGQPRFGESTFEGIGFGFGVSVTLDPARAQILGTPGEYAWGGAASTAFWTDPGEDMTVIFLTQLMPSDAYPLRRELRVLTYQALVD